MTLISYRHFIIAGLACLMAFNLSCTNGKIDTHNSLFTLMPQNETNINFINEIIETENINPLQYENSYSGGGVAIGDLNGDGLEDIYFTGNRTANQLYLNKGKLKFEDVTLKSGTQGRESWKTGVTMADVNGDGRLDIYVCHSGDFDGQLRANELFINKGNDANGLPLFIEEAKLFGLDDSAFSMQAAFFDSYPAGSPEMFRPVQDSPPYPVEASCRLDRAR